jgi:hypothetical protein
MDSVCTIGLLGSLGGCGGGIRMSVSSWCDMVDWCGVYEQRLCICSMKLFDNLLHAHGPVLILLPF